MTPSKTYNRRQFLELAAAGAASTLAFDPSSLLAATPILITLKGTYS